MKRKVTNEIQMMDISLNLARVGTWTADSYESKKSLINIFLTQTEGYVEDLRKQKLPDSMKSVFVLFEKEFARLLRDKDKIDREVWAERALTWANILQHMAKTA